MAEKAQKQDNTAKQFILFFFIGSLNFFIRQIVFTLVSYFGVHEYICNFCGFTAAVISTYFINGTFIFKKQEGEKRVWWKVMGRLYIAYAFTGLILTTFLLWLFITKINLSQYMPDVIASLKLEELMSKLEANLAAKGNELTAYEWIAKQVSSVITILIVTPLNFIVNKYWAYKK